MRLTQKLLSFLHRVFDKDPAKFLALRLRYSGTSMQWAVVDAVLTTTVTGGTGVNLTADLTQYTLGQLVTYLASQPGYTVEYADMSELSQLSARVLLDGAGDMEMSNGDHLYGYTSLLWSYLEAQAVELKAAAQQINEALKQVQTTTAADEWLDELGGYYGVPRLSSEVDEQYGPRIIAEVLRPRANNVAMQMAISAYTGQTTTVTDVTLWTNTPPLYNGVYNYDGSQLHNSTSVPIYDLFDVEYGYDLLNGGDITSFTQIVHDLVNRLRDAGTHLRSLLLKGSVISDSLTPPTDGGSGQSIAIGTELDDTLTSPDDPDLSLAVAFNTLADSLTAPADDESVTINYSTLYNGLRRYDGAVPYNSGGSTVEVI